jgi:hypothetical protein
MTEASRPDTTFERKGPRGPGLETRRELGEAIAGFRSRHLRNGLLGGEA